MSKGGKAWRGWFAVGDELTSGLPDQKEGNKFNNNLFLKKSLLIQFTFIFQTGLYFGKELAESESSLPMHGPNLFPERPAELKSVVLEYFDEMTKLGARVMRHVAQGLGLPPNTFEDGSILI